MELKSKAAALEQPTFNLKAVVQETGLKADTLRAWERRYGIPEPHRTESGHRLYSAHDIAVLKWLIARQSEGLTISRAVALWERLIKDGLDPLDEAELRVLPAPSPSHVEAAPSSPSTLGADSSTGIGNNIVELRRQWIRRCLAYDERGAEEILERAFSIFSPETVSIDLLFAGISEIGRGWGDGQITAHQEHFASSLALRRLNSLHNGTPPPTKSQRIVVGCPPEEAHVIAPLLLSLLLRRRGWEVIYLGANVPQDDLASTLSAIRPELVILTAQQLHTAGTLLEIGHILFEHGVPLAFGGAIFVRSHELQNCIPGYYLGDRIDSATTVVEGIMMAPRVQPARSKAPTDYLKSLKSFREHRAHIENELASRLGDEFTRRTVDEANVYLAQNILAALTLCPCERVELELRGVASLLMNCCHMSRKDVSVYLNNYLDTATHYLKEDAQVVIGWLRAISAGEKNIKDEK